MRECTLGPLKESKQSTEDESLREELRGEMLCVGSLQSKNGGNFNPHKEQNNTSSDVGYIK